MFNTAFDAFTNERTDYYPSELRGEIDASTSACSRASTTASIARALPARRRPTRKPSSICSPRWTGSKRNSHASGISRATHHRSGLAAVHHHPALRRGLLQPLSKCNLRRIADYPNLSNYLRELYQVPGVADTVSMDHISGTIT